MLPLLTSVDLVMTETHAPDAHPSAPATNGSSDPVVAEVLAVKYLVGWLKKVHNQCNSNEQDM